MNAVAEGRDQRLHVAVRATGDRAPGGPPPQLQHTVILEELREEAGGKAPHLTGVRGPDRRGLRHEQPLDEVLRVATVGEEAAEGRSVVAAADQLASLAVEANEVAQHPVKTGIEGVPGPGEEPARPPGRPLESPRSSETEKLISAGWEGTPARRASARSWGS